MRAALRISPLAPLSPDADRVLVQATLPDGTRREAAVELRFAVTAAEIADLQWYFESFAQFDDDPAPAMARQIEQHLRDRGRELFEAVLAGNDEVRSLWRAFDPHAADAELEIVSEHAAGSAIHWEFLGDRGGRPLSMRMRGFVRVPSSSGPAPGAPPDGNGPLRVLLAIERPDGANDVPYRSVAAGLVRATEGGRIRIDVVRPAGFDRLQTLLVDAAGAGKPYDILHFDGHGTYGNLGPHGGARGFLVFEDRRAASGRRLVDGRTLGALLARTGTGILVLNACRSAYARPQPAGRPAVDGTERSAGLTIGSLADEAIRAGARHVVAMRYNLYVATATRFFARLYAALGRGRTLGEAVVLARRDLARRSATPRGPAETSLQDWAVPAHFRAAGADDPRRPRVPEPVARAIAAPARFIARHETLYRIDRWLDDRPIVVLWGQAGIGKSATAREFAAWYLRTRGTEGPIELTELRDRAPPDLFLDGADPPALPDVLDALAAQRGLWIVDGVERLAPAQHARLRAIALAVAGRGGKVLVTARTAAGWTSPAVAPVLLPAMRAHESIELVTALLGDDQARSACVRGVVRVGNGNPQVLCLLAGLATASDDDAAAPPLEALVAGLAAGTADLEGARLAPLRDLVTELRAALPAFDATEQAMIAPLQLFRGYSSVAALGTMGETRGHQGVAALAGATVASLTGLFQRLVSSGLAHDFSHGSYGLHAVLPLVLRPVFEQHHPPGSPIERTVRAAFCGSLATGCAIATKSYNETSNAAVLQHLDQLDGSLASAWEISCAGGWWESAATIFAGRCLRAYETNQRDVLGRLLDDAAPVFSAPPRATSERDAGWRFWTDYRVRLLRRRGDLPGAEAVLNDLVARQRELAAGALRAERPAWSPEDRDRVLALANALYQLGAVTWMRGDPTSGALLAEAAELARRGEARGLAAKAALLSRKTELLAAEPPGQVPPELQAAILDDNGSVAGQAWVMLGTRKLDVVTQLLTDNPEDSDALKLRARALLAAARTAFDRAVAVLPSHLERPIAEAYLQRGQTELQLFGCDGALDDWKAACASLAIALRRYERIDDAEMAAKTRVSLALLMRYVDRLDRATLYAAPALAYYDAHDPRTASALRAEMPWLA